jgi:hypothetical protein
MADVVEQLGPDCNSYRTQFMKRLVDFSQESGLTIEPAYYPPYHSHTRVMNALSFCTRLAHSAGV